MTVPLKKNDTVDPLLLSLSRGANGTVVSWTPVEGADSYHVIRGDLRSIVEHSNAIDLGDVVCLAKPVEDAAIPPPGVAYFYLAEYLEGGAVHGYGTEPVSKPHAVSSGGCSFRSEGRLLEFRSVAKNHSALPWNWFFAR